MKMNTTTNTSQSATRPAEGWKSYYYDLTRTGNIPNAASASINANNAVFYASYLDLADVQQQIANSGHAPVIITIYTDVLNIKNVMAWEIAENTALMIYARVIDFQPQATFGINLTTPDAAGEANLGIYAQQVNGTIQIASQGNAKHILAVTQADIKQGIGFVCTKAKGLQSRPLTLAQGFPASVTQAQQNYLNNSFLYGALSADAYPAIAVDILTWVNAWAGACASANTNSDADALSQLYYASSNLASLFKAQLVAAESGDTYVPCLSKAVYQGIASKMEAALSNSQQDYLTVFTAEKATQEFIQSASALKSVYSNNQSQVQELLQQSELAYNQAFSAEQIASSNFKQQQIKVLKAGSALNEAMANYIDKEKVTAVFNIGKAIASFAVGIAGIVTGNEEAAPAAAEGAAAAKSVVSLASEMKQLKKFAEGMEKLYQLSEAVYKSSKTLADSGQSVNPQTAANGPQFNTDDSINSIAAWTGFQNQADTNIEPIVKLGINEASEYRVTLDNLVALGKALASAKLATIQAAQKVAAMNVQLSYAQKNTQVISKLVGDLKQDQTDILQLQQLFYHQALNLQIGLYSFLKSYQATYLYWALKPSTVEIPLGNIANMVSHPHVSLDMSLSEYQALTGLQSQAMQLVEVDITDTAVISALQSTGKTQWSVPLTCSDFAGLDRVRFTEVRIWLIGEGLYTPNQQQTVNLTVQTDGHYQDRLNGKQFNFSSSAFNNRFEYYVNNPDMPQQAIQLATGVSGAIAMACAAAPGQGNDYFIPTPFSNWVITVPATGRQIDLSKVQSIKMQFQGSAIAA